MVGGGYFEKNLDYNFDQTVERQYKKNSNHTLNFR